MFLIKNHVTRIQCIQHYGGWQNIGCIIHKYMWKQKQKVICHLVKECIFYKQQGEQLTTYAWNHFPYVFSLSSVMLLQWMNYSYPQFYYLIQDYIDSVIFVWTKGMLMLDIISDRSRMFWADNFISNRSPIPNNISNFQNDAHFGFGNSSAPLSMGIIMFA
jgi:hypothetical protein